MKITKKLNKFISILTITLLMIMQVSTAWAQTAPEPPTAPEAPSVSDEPPSAPEAPSEPSDTLEAPTAPDAPLAPGETSDEEDSEDREEDQHTHDHEQTDEEEANESSAESTTNNEENTQITESTGSTADGQVGDPSITTGDATNTASIATTANTNIATNDDCLECSSEGAVVKNTDNGSGSDNSGIIAHDNETSTTQTNNATVINRLDQETTTGDNSASKNVGNSSISTGDANTSGTLITAVNTNIDGVAVSEFNVVDDHVGDIILDFAANCVSGCSGLDSALVENTGNGSDSQNESLYEGNTNNVVFQNNNADIINEMILLSDTGNNKSDNNTGGDSSISTGDANVSANALTFANNNLSGNVFYNVVNIFGNLLGDIIFPEESLAYQTQISNIGNGNGSNNASDVNLESLDQTFQFKVADISNNLELVGTTGNNKTSANTGGNSYIETGDVEIDAQVLNVVNSNITGGVWWLVIINEAGNWIGKLFGAPEGYNFAGSSGTDFQVDENGGITAVNSGNGSESQNQANINQQSNDTLIQNNNASVQNNLKLEANTGGNSASRNTGGDSSISTGDANIIANLVNFVNNNISGGGKLFVNVVNVFGSWVGDFLSPGYTKEASSDTQEQTSGGGAGGYSAQESSSGSSNSSNDNKNSDSNSSSDNSSAGQLLAQAASTFRPFTSGAFLGSKVTNDTSEVLSGNTSAETAAKKIVNVNLAWLILLLPLLVVVRIARRKLIA